MIRGMHGMFYTSEPKKMREFLRDKLKFPSTDVGEGWLIFEMPEADLGCHPADPENGAPSGTAHISFYCDDIEVTVAELKKQGVKFTAPVADHGYGFVTYFKMPGEITAQLYQPKYKKGPATKQTKEAKKMKEAKQRMKTKEVKKTKQTKK